MKEFYINAEYENFGWDIRIIERNPKTNKVAYVSNIKMTVAETSEIIPPSMTLNDDEIQSLINELWRNGIRPTNQVDEGGKLKIMKYHLEDMRRLVFKSNYTEDGKK